MTLQIHLKEVPTSPLTSLDIEKQDKPVDGVDYEVLFEGTVIGIIPASIAWRQNTLRWQDVVQPLTLKRKREPAPHDKSLLLLAKCLYTPSSKPHLFRDPFPHGSDSIEELAMIGGERFERTFQLYNHWFKAVSPIQRMERELRDFDPSLLTTDELKMAEKRLKQLWVQTHGTLMKRLS